MGSAVFTTTAICSCDASLYLYIKLFPHKPLYIYNGTINKELPNCALLKYVGNHRLSPLCK